MPGPMPSPPPIRGLSQTSEDESPLDAMLRKLSAKPQPAMSLVREASDLLRRAAKLDPQIRPLVGEMLRPLNQGADEEDDEDAGEPTGRTRPGQDYHMNRETGPMRD